MDLIKLAFLAAVLALSAASPGAIADGGDVAADDGLDAFPLDDDSGGGDRTDEGGGDLGGQRQDQDQDQDQGNELEDINLSEAAESESNRQELLKKVMAAAMSKPGARQRLAQVMPILRTMSAPQRLALAGLVTSQLMAGEGAPPPAVPRNATATRTNLTDDLMIPISMDIAAMFRGLGRDSAARSTLFRGDLYKRHPPYRRRPPQTLNRRNTEVPYEEMRPPPPPSMGKLPKIRPSPSVQPTSADQTGTDCEYFTNTVCLQVNDYPMEAILKSIQSTPNKNSFEALRHDAKLDLSNVQAKTDPGMERRQGGGESGETEAVCQSRVELARPKRARATSGQWKYIVNTGDYTQTLRLEMCSNPKQSCSYLMDNLKSECVQVYNYHRLLTWDKKSGLTMDIFKVPTCCSCHVQGRSLPLPHPGKRTEGLTASESVRVSQHRRPPAGAFASDASAPAPETNFVVAEEPAPPQRLPPKLIRTRRPLHNLYTIPKREPQVYRTKPPRDPAPRPAEDGPQAPPPARHHPLQYENLLRRTSPRNHTEYHDSRPKYHPVQPTLNQRHPELPVDSLLADDSPYAHVTSVPDYQPPPRPAPPRRVTTPFRRPTAPPPPPPPPTQPPSPAETATAAPPGGGGKRVNYSYHPIIDFFKTSVTAAEAGERVGQAGAEWTPITDGPRVMPK